MLTQSLIALVLFSVAQGAAYQQPPQPYQFQHGTAQNQPAPWNPQEGWPVEGYGQAPPGMHSYIGRPGGPRRGQSIAQICANGDPGAVASVQCSNVAPQDFLMCFSTSKRDDTVAALIRLCAPQLPPNFMSAALQLRAAGLFSSFNELLSANRCNTHLDIHSREDLLQIIARDNDPQYASACLRLCHFSRSFLQSCAMQARQSGWTFVEPLLSNAADSNQPSFETYPTQAQAGVSGAPPPIEDKNVLASLTPSDFERFGTIGNVCAGLGPEHFQNPDLRASSLSYMNANCFRNLQPSVFSGMSGEQIAALRHWEVASPDQVGRISIGAIQQLPFASLGRYRQRSGADTFHPCHGITSAQRMSLRLNSEAWEAYNNRCKKSTSASPPKPSASAGALAFAFILALLLA